MGWRKSATVSKNLKICAQVLGLLLICVPQFSRGLTNPNDQFQYNILTSDEIYWSGLTLNKNAANILKRLHLDAAISQLHAALGYPVLPGWGIGQDPCGDAWQGVVCNISDIVKIVLNAANLGGELGDNLAQFASITAIDLSNNQIGGSIPSNLPATLQNFFLSANQFTGSIPNSFSSLTQLTALSLNDNYLSGEIPDSFENLHGLVNLDLSNNNLSGPLPPSMENLFALTTLRLQTNQLSGTLDVLQDLPLKDLNIENNLFSGPIPVKLLNVPKFRNDGNPFNSSVSPVLPPSPPSKQSPVPFFSGEPSSEESPENPADRQSSSNESKSGNFLTTKKVVWLSIAGVLSFIILALVLVLFMPRCIRGSMEVGRNFKRHQIGAYKGDKESPKNDMPSTQPTNKIQKVPKDAVEKPKEGYQEGTQRIGVIPELKTQKRDDHKIDISALDDYLIPSPPPPPPTSIPVKVIKEPSIQTEVTPMKPSATKLNTATFVKSFTIAFLQQCTNSFSQENLIGGGMLGNVYRAMVPSGKLLAVKKLDKRSCSQQKDDDFLEMVNNIDTIRHHNIVELLGYCAEHDQRLLIYEYCDNGTLQDALHSDNETKRNLSWNIRIQVALGAARALEYLHEVCQPPVMHRNFKSANILLDDDYAVRVSDCGLSPLISSGSVSQLSGHLQSVYGWGAPEYELGIYTLKSDVYSFGVVMLEILTGRMPYDRTRIRGEQFLVRWAIPQLHDINALSRMVDSSLGLEYPPKSLSHFADIISRCVQSEPEFRPAMSEVVQDLLEMMRREPLWEWIGGTLT